MGQNQNSILVTGGAGYIGSHTIVELIKCGYLPIIIDDFSKSDTRLLEAIPEITGEKIQFIQGNCSDIQFLRNIFSNWRISAVIHFAAFKSVSESVQYPLLYFRNNVDSLISVLEVMKEFDITDLIFSSSCTVYGQPKNIPVSESEPFLKAESPYGVTKQIGEQILESSYSSGYRIVSLRYFNPVGAHPSALIGELPLGTPNNLVPYLTQVAAGERQSLTVFGDDYDTPDGSCIRDFIHVMDVASAHVKSIEFLKNSPSNKNFFESFNLGTGNGVSVFELINIFKEANSIDLNFSIGPRRPGDVVKVFADPTKIMSQMGWKPGFSLSEAMVHAWNWQKKISKLTL